ncbi:MAG TPA: hypothetical protein DCP62_00125 [Erysipelotrichaceae bacterium]|nr:hypothetical protein [Erysipelotrichaceae bacterium]
MDWLLQSIATNLVWAALGAMMSYILFLRKQLKSMKNALVALLRNAIVSAYNKSVERKFAPIFERENVQKLFDEYKILGGNGTIDHLIDEFHELPTHQIEQAP